MIRFFRNKRGLGAPVGNLIILTAAVLLSTTVVLFAMNVTTSQVQKENMFITTSHVWYVNSTYSLVAVSITDNGPTDIVLSRIVVKGTQCTWNGTENYVVYNKSNETLPGDLPFFANFTNIIPETNTPTNNITIANQQYNFTVAGEGLTLKSGWTMTFYIALPQAIMVYDLSMPIRIVISTTQSVYFTETLVQTT